MTAAEGDGEIRVGISACLLGERVRYDGGHKHDAFLTHTVGKFVSFVPVCPEVDIGLGTPRETIRLERRPEGTRLVAPKSGADHTEAMTRYAARKVVELEDLDLCGYILKKDSPSCGFLRVRLYDHNGVPSRDGRGLFAAALVERHPLLPVEEEGRLHDPRLRESFFERVFAYRRLKDFFRGRWSLGGLVEFHSREKLLLMAHDRVSFDELGRMVAHGKERPRAALADEYSRVFLSGLAKLATVRKHTNALQHAAGYCKRSLDAGDKAELHGTIADFHRGLVPLVVPVALLRHHVRRLGITYLERQTYLEPHPKELMLRNHV